MNEIVSNNINGYCMPTIKIDKIRNQIIFDVDDSVFLDYFKKLVKNPENIYKMKKETSFLLEKNINQFNSHFKEKFNE